MSLDVYLKYHGKAMSTYSSGIFIRRNGSTVEITREEWDELYPDREPVVMQLAEETDIVYEANITHNLNRMARSAGLYEALWRPEELFPNQVIYARLLIPYLIAGANELVSDPEKYKEFNPINGWGSYDDLYLFVEKYTIACSKFPDAQVEVSR